MMEKSGRVFRKRATVIKAKKYERTVARKLKRLASIKFSED